MRARVPLALLAALLVFGCRREVELTVQHALNVVACAPNGAGCGGDADCCSSSCMSGKCVTPACRAEGSPCAVPGDCCSFQCAPDPVGGAMTVCRAAVECSSDGQPCAQAGDCCNLGCTAGVCGAPRCKPVGAMCATAADCCEGTCIGGLCAKTDPACHPAGEPCTGNADCCGSLCGKPDGSGASVLSWATLLAILDASDEPRTGTIGWRSLRCGPS